jgi:Kef-type K+ transport system membrane component KefB
MYLIYAYIEDIWAHINWGRSLSKRERMWLGVYLAITLFVINLLLPVAEWMAKVILQTFPKLHNQYLVYLCLLFLTALVTILACFVVCFVRERIKDL